MTSHTHGCDLTERRGYRFAILGKHGNKATSTLIKFEWIY
jgi:hypothetical protein